MGRKTTLKELAVLLGLSISTVSKALSDSDEISEGTKTRVRELAKARNYHHNKLASSFRTGSTKVIGVILPSLTDTFYTEVLFGIEKLLAAEGYAMMVAVSNDSASKEAKAVRSMSSGYVDGLIISNANETLSKASNKSMSIPLNEGMPLVLFGRPNPTVDCDQVLNDFSKVSFGLVEYLYKRHYCKNLALLGKGNDWSNTQAKINGFEEALNRFELPRLPNSLMIGEEQLSFQNLTKVAKKGDYDGYICLDYWSYGAITSVLSRLPRALANKVQITTFGNLHSLQERACAAMDLRAEKVGQLAAKTLLKRIKNKKIDNHSTQIVTGNLIAYGQNTGPKALQW
ncbi:LacI family transcriptional regulator [Muricauda sp. SCSIO 64092]|uniref:LacI family DNA-binding transcriptional regulator n=1 Tax=Allomuricauda sp. SCSIO 64092 TaxID=2908842 RepID=UPI001FF1EC6A|nr:LacI family DNA-binding transcriptional regulator [Muricauda sp. SCSIO 64092]UOY04954.1 LacI family transcriptional regulator [Muricauda sp. SCSIO 64092]